MRTITIVIAMITMFFPADKVFSGTYVGTAIVSVRSGLPHFTDIFFEPDEDNDISDKAVQPDFFNVSSADPDNGSTPFKSFYITQIGEEPRMKILLDYECRAP